MSEDDKTIDKDSFKALLQAHKIDIPKVGDFVKWVAVIRRGRTSSRELGRTCRITAVRRCRERYNSASDIAELRVPRPIRHNREHSERFCRTVYIRTYYKLVIN